jgi:hypothetical protein
MTAAVLPLARQAFSRSFTIAADVAGFTMAQPPAAPDLS